MVTSPCRNSTANGKTPPVRELIIIGAGGHGRVVADIAQALGYEMIRFVDASFPDLSQSGAWPVIAKTHEETAGEIALAIGNNKTRMRILETVSDRVVSLVHPSASVSPYAAIGAGSVVCTGATVGAFAVLGRGCIINTGASVDHDCTLADGVHISPGARLGGGVQIGPRTWVGIGAAVREYKTLGKDVIIGAGAAVVANVPDNKRMGGVPAKEF